MNPTPQYSGHLGHSVKRLYHLTGQYFNDVLRPYGVAHSQWYVLYAMSQSPHLTQKDLQAAMRVESATLTGMIHGLERKGWIERRQSPRDKRLKELHLTAAGRRLWDSLPDPILAIRARMLEGISPADEQTAQRILDRAIENFEPREIKERITP